MTMPSRPVFLNLLHIRMPADQYRLGHMLLAIGACYALWLAWHALRGTPQNIEQTQR
jgi:hypothetical protein